MLAMILRFFLVSVGASLLLTGCPKGIIEEAQTVANVELNALAATLNAFSRDTGQFPTTEEGLNLLVERRLLLGIPNDPWGRPYQYVALPSTKRGYDVFSFGPDPAKDSDDIHLK